MRGTSATTAAAVLVALATAAFAGCIEGAGVDAAASAGSPCAHPWPCADGTEWPPDLAGPFELASVEPMRVAARDGTVLDGWLAMPDVPKGVKVPVLLSVSPYFGFCNARPDLLLQGVAVVGCIPTPGDEEWWTDDPHIAAGTSWGVAPISLVREGYAVALFNERGTGGSGGCYSVGLFQKGDEATLVDVLADAPWSNGRVAIGGLSASAMTAALGAVAAPPGLKSVVFTGIATDMYTWFHTPQGAAHPFFNGVMPATHSASVALLPPLVALDAPLATEHACESTADGIASPLAGMSLDDRDAARWDAQRLLDDVHEIDAAVLLVHGFDDRLGHVTQENEVFRLLDSPKRQVVGQWGHTWPRPSVVELDPRWEHSEWEDLLGAWLDFWLKGVGEAPEGLGRVDHQDSAGVWRVSASWPPPEARKEALYLAGNEILGAPGAGARTFRAAPSGNDVGQAQLFGLPVNSWPALCDPTGASSATALLYATRPMEETVVLAGNPFAYLRISSDLPGGIVSVEVLEVPADFSCDAVGEPPAVELVSHGAADLRFHEGNFVGRDFPVGSPTMVRIDLWDLAEAIEAGNRLAVLVSQGESPPAYGRAGQPFYPAITVIADGGAEASHVVLPVVAGTLGGAAPTLAYPLRPFVP